MRKKVFPAPLAAILLLTILLAACAKDDASKKPNEGIKSGTGSISASAQPAREEAAFTPEELTEMQEQAKLLTEHLVDGSFRHYTFDPGDNKKIIGKEPIVPADVNNLVLTTAPRYLEQPGYLYSDFYSRIPNGPYCYPREKVNQQVYEVFGLEGDWNLQGGDTAYNSEKGQFETGLEYEVGGSHSCKEILESRVGEGSDTLEVDFLLSDNLGFEGETGWQEYGSFTMSFQLMRENGRMFLRYLKLEQSK